MIRTIIEGSHEQLNTYESSFLFNEQLKSYGSLFFKTSYETNMPYLCLVEDIKISTKFPKRNICNISCIKINTFFVIFDNKYWGISKSDQNILYLKERMLVMESLSSINAMKLATQNHQKKVVLFRKYLSLKKFSFWKSSCFEDIPAWKNYIFWIITYSGKKSLQVAVLKNFLSLRSSWLKKCLLARNSY